MFMRVHLISQHTLLKAHEAWVNSFAQHATKPDLATVHSNSKYASLVTSFWTMWKCLLRRQCICYCSCHWSWQVIDKLTRSWQVIFLNTNKPDERVYLLKSNINQLPDNAEVAESNIIARYAQRSNTLHNVSLAEYAVYYDNRSAAEVTSSQT